MQGDEEQAIIKEMEAFAGVWGRGDAKAAASFYAEDATRVGAFGDVSNMAGPRLRPPTISCFMGRCREQG